MLGWCGRECLQRMVSPLIYERAEPGGTHRRRVNGSRLARATSADRGGEPDDGTAICRRILRRADDARAGRKHCLTASAQASCYRTRGCRFIKTDIRARRTTLSIFCIFARLFPKHVYHRLIFAFVKHLTQLM